MDNSNFHAQRWMGGAEWRFAHYPVTVSGFAASFACLLWMSYPSFGLTLKLEAWAAWILILVRVV